MKSTTAAATRKQEEMVQQNILPGFVGAGMKRGVDGMLGPMELQQQLLISQLLQKKGRFTDQSQLQNSSQYSNPFCQAQQSQAAQQLQPPLSLQNMMHPSMNLQGPMTSQSNGAAGKKFGLTVCQGRQNDSSLLGQFLPNATGGVGNGVQTSLTGKGSTGQGLPLSLTGGLPSSSTTADIVNAAIEALRYG